MAMRFTLLVKLMCFPSILLRRLVTRDLCFEPWKVWYLELATGIWNSVTCDIRFDPWTLWYLELTTGLWS